MSSSDSTPALALNGAWAYQSPDAGDVVLTGRTRCPGGIGLTTHGIALGPVELSAYDGSAARIKDLQYGAQESGFFDSWGNDWFGDDSGPSGNTTNTTDDSDFFGASAMLGLGGAAVATAQQPEEANPELTRRNVLVSTGLALLGTASAVEAVRAAESQVSVARFELPANPGGLRVRLRDLAPEFLTTDGLYYVLINGMDYAEFRGGTNQSGDIPPIPDGETRQVEVTTDAGGILGAVKEYAGKKELTYHFTLSPRPAGGKLGEQIVITDHPMIREAALRAGAGGVTLEIGGESIPHQTEGSGDEVGWYGVRDGDVVYQVGAEPPGGSQATFTVYAGIVEEVTDDANQLV